MFEYIGAIAAKFGEISKANPMVAGAVPLWGLSVGTFLLRNIPTRIVTSIKGQVTTTLVFNNIGDYNSELFSSFNKWFLSRKSSKFSRGISILPLSKSALATNNTLGVGEGNHYFLFKGRPFVFSKKKLPSDGVYFEKEEITITGLCRSHKIFEELIAKFLPEINEGKLNVYQYRNQDWQSAGVSSKRDISTVITPNSVKENIIRDMTEFYASEQWYSDRGFNYKLVILLYGPPGTGKTSLIKSIAAHFRKDIYIANLSTCGDTAFQDLMREIPAKAICAMEDFDDLGSVQERGGKPDMVPRSVPVGGGMHRMEMAEPSRASDRPKSMLSMSTILNALDGIVDLNGNVVFMTTNHIDKIDKALLRKGRVDFKYYVGLFTDTEVRMYIQMVFPELTDLPEEEFEDILGCDISAIFKENRDDSDKFLSLIPMKKVAEQPFPIKYVL